MMDVATLISAIETVDAYNKMPLDDFVSELEPQVGKISGEYIEEFKHTGLNNADFLVTFLASIKPFSKQWWRVVSHKAYLMTFKNPSNVWHKMYEYSKKRSEQ